MINVLWLASDRMGCGSYRCYIPALGLKEANVADASFMFHEQVTSPEKVTESDLDGIHAVVFQRAVGTYFIEIMKVCKARGIATIFELDDNIFDLPRHNPAAWFWRRKAIQRLLRTELELVDRVIVSTRPLMQTMQIYMAWPATNKIRVCMNHLHPAVWGESVWGRVLPYHNQQTVIGWQGSTTHDTDFKEALPALRQLVLDDPAVMLRFFGNVPSSVRGVIPEHRFQWTKGVAMEKYPATLRFMNFDIGIAPVTDSAFNQCKSNIKWLEYSALGIPAVCSRVYPYAKSITEGETGYLASTTDEWYTTLKTLVADADLRKRVGAQAQAHVWDVWSFRTHNPKWADALCSVAQLHPTLDEIISGNGHGRPVCVSPPTQPATQNPPTS